MPPAVCKPRGELLEVEVARHRLLPPIAPGREIAHDTVAASEIAPGSSVRDE
jgi:hypothetical protein